MDNKDTYGNAAAKRIIENLNVATLLFDDQLHLEYINPAGEMLFAISARQANGLTSDELFGHPNALSDALVKAHDESHALTEREIELTLPDHRTVTVDCTVTPITEPQKGQMLLLELQQIDRQLRILREENLIAQHDATHAVVRGLAHEINNPLGGLRGAAQLLEKELDDEALKEYTSVIIGEADRLRNLLSRLLGPYARPQLRRTNIHEILERVRVLVLAETPQGINIKRDYDPSIPEPWIEADQMIQAVLNIVRNAIQALGENGVITLRTRAKRQFTIGARRHKLVLCLEIIDNGPGIPPDIVEKIFYPMISGRAEGTGLGLSIAQTLVHQHGGLIECESRPGCTTFTLLLPLDRNND